MKRSRGWAVAALALATCGAALAGCGPIYGTDHFVMGTRQAAHIQPVEIVWEEDPVPADVEEIGIVRAMVIGYGPHDAELWERLRREARALGANLIIHARSDETEGMHVVMGLAVRAP